MGDLTKIVDPDNEQSEWSTDYTSLNAWCIAYGAVPNTGDCVGETTRAIADCRCSDGTADTTNAGPFGWTSSNASYYPYIKIHENFRFDKIWPAAGNIYRLANTGQINVFDIQVDHTRVEGLAVRNTAGHGAHHTVKVSLCTEVLIDSCLFVIAANGYSPPSAVLFQSIDTGQVYMKNTLCYDEDNTWGVLITGQNCDGGEVVLHHCTLIDGYEALYEDGTSEGGTFTANNCVTYGNDAVGGGTWGGDYNGYSTGNPPGANDILVANGDFTDYASRDYTVKDTDSALYAVCPTLYADAILPVPEDWEEDPRSSTADVCCGWDEYYVSPPAASVGEMFMLF